MDETVGKQESDVSDPPETKYVERKPYATLHDAVPEDESHYYRDSNDVKEEPVSEMKDFLSTAGSPELREDVEKKLKIPVSRRLYISEEQLGEKPVLRRMLIKNDPDPPLYDVIDSGSEYDTLSEGESDETVEQREYRVSQLPKKWKFFLTDTYRVTASRFSGFFVRFPPCGGLTMCVWCLKTLPTSEEGAHQASFEHERETNKGRRIRSIVRVRKAQALWGTMRREYKESLKVKLRTNDDPFVIMGNANFEPTFRRSQFLSDVPPNRFLMGLEVTAVLMELDTATPSVFVCFLCHFTIANKIDFLRHVESTDHRMKYVRTYLKSFSEMLEKKDMDLPLMFNRLACTLQRSEGRFEFWESTVMEYETNGPAMKHTCLELRTHYRGTFKALAKHVMVHSCPYHCDALPNFDVDEADEADGEMRGGRMQENPQLAETCAPSSNPLSLEQYGYGPTRSDLLGEIPRNEDSPSLLESTDGGDPPIEMDFQDCKGFVAPAIDRRKMLEPSTAAPRRQNPDPGRSSGPSSVAQPERHAGPSSFSGQSSRTVVGPSPSNWRPWMERSNLKYKGASPEVSQQAPPFRAWHSSADASNGQSRYGADASSSNGRASRPNLPFEGPRSSWAGQTSRHARPLSSFKQPGKQSLPFPASNSSWAASNRQWGQTGGRSSSYRQSWQGNVGYQSAGPSREVPIHNQRPTFQAPHPARAASNGQSGQNSAQFSVKWQSCKQSPPFHGQSWQRNDEYKPAGPSREVPIHNQRPAFQALHPARAASNGQSGQNSAQSSFKWQSCKQSPPFHEQTWQPNEEYKPAGPSREVPIHNQRPAFQAPHPARAASNGQSGQNSAQSSIKWQSCKQSPPFHATQPAWTGPNTQPTQYGGPSSSSGIPWKPELKYTLRVPQPLLSYPVGFAYRAPSPYTGYYGQTPSWQQGRMFPPPTNSGFLQGHRSAKDEVGLSSFGRGNSYNGQAAVKKEEFDQKLGASSSESAENYVNEVNTGHEEIKGEFKVGEEQNPDHASCDQYVQPMSVKKEEEMLGAGATEEGGVPDGRSSVEERQGKASLSSKFLNKMNEEDSSSDSGSSYTSGSSYSDDDDLVPGPSAKVRRLVEDVRDSMTENEEHRVNIMSEDSASNHGSAGVEGVRRTVVKEEPGLAGEDVMNQDDESYDSGLFESTLHDPPDFKYDEQPESGSSP